ncbi:hypothetical protein Goari_006619, partial [Gossypium aridum]|nr:hypothetical protein [Gossypium aridum]
YGISFARPSRNIIIRRLTGHNRNGSGIAIGSEMSGGVSEVYAENIYFFNSSTDTAIFFNSNFSQHPDEFYDPNSLPVIERITFKDVIGDNIKVAGLLKGILLIGFPRNLRTSEGKYLPQALFRLLPTTEPSAEFSPSPCQGNVSRHKKLIGVADFVVV